MGYRQIYIKKSDKINFKDNQLVVCKEEEETKIPLEDINFILLEDTTTIVTTRLLAEIGKNGIALIVCDEKHLPTSIMYPYNYHYKQLENLELQLTYTENIKDELWKMIIISKIKNQKHLIESKIKDEYTIEKMDQFINEVDNGDTGNREGLAAKMYFRCLFGSNFIRHFDDGINNALNYGYTILSSCLIRLLSTYGLLTYYGINHKSKTNNFNLAYDFVEPFRPIVDEFVFENMDLVTDELSYDIRKQLLNLLNKEIIVNGKHCTVEYGMDLLIQSYLKVLNTGEIKLSLPSLVYG